MLLRICVGSRTLSVKVTQLCLRNLFAQLAYATCLRKFTKFFTRVCCLLFYARRIRLKHGLRTQEATGGRSCCLSFCFRSSDFEGMIRRMVCTNARKHKESCPFSGWCFLTRVPDACCCYADAVAHWHSSNNRKPSLVSWRL